MTAEKFREALAAEPFRPFWLLTADGRRYRVPSREFVLLPPRAERTFIVATGRGEETVMLDLLLVVGLEFTPSRQKRRRAG